MTSSPAAEQVLALLQNHVSPINARSMLRHALRAADLDEATLERRHLPTIAAALEKAVRLFVDDAARVKISSALWALVPKRLPLPPVVFALENEQDVNKARVAARMLCTEASAPSLASQKIATVVSELARNIVKYAGAGRVEIMVSPEPPPSVTIRAVDEGPGISNLELIFSGTYKSKTGMGLGLLGTRRMADAFDIRSDATGTTVVAMVKL